MKKRWISAAWLTVVMVLFVLTGSLSTGIIYAEEINTTVVAASVVRDFNWNITNGVLKITGNGDMPDWSEEEPAPWYSQRYDITAVKIGKGITSIGGNAFSDCTSLKTVTIPDSVASIDTNAFARCSYLNTITIPDSVTSIGDDAFAECSRLQTITLPDSIASIGDSVFCDCISMTNITIPNSVTSIGDGAFAGCYSLKTIMIPDSVTVIGDSTFWGCSRLKTITLPNSVTAIGDWAFYDCVSLGDITLPDRVTSIGHMVFCGCVSLKTITLPDSLISIDNSAFFRCSSLKTITLPDRVTSIGENAFYHCTSLSNITFPDSLTSIGDGAFHSCASLTKITLPDSVTSIGSGAFYHCTSLTNITLPNNLTSMGGDMYGGFMFMNCSSLKNITIPDSVTSIGAGTFSDCTSLTSIILPDGVTLIGADAFKNCTSLKNITIPRSVTSIRYFYGNCPSLTILTWRNSYAWKYAIDHNIPVIALDDSEVEKDDEEKEEIEDDEGNEDDTNLLDISISVHETSSCTENDRIGTMYYACGNFFWDKKTGTDEIERTNYDVCYLNVTTTNPDEEDEAENVVIQLTAPEGFSFSETEMVSEKELTCESLAVGQKNTEVIPVYPICISGEELPTQTLDFTVTSSSSIHDENEVTLNGGVALRKSSTEGMVFMRDSFPQDPANPGSWRDTITPDFSGFAYGSSAYDRGLALISSAFSAAVYKYNDIEATLKNFGFSKIQRYNYNLVNDQVVLSADEVAAALASKKMIIDGKITTVVAIIVRGTVEKEWYGNFDVGDGVRHAGFENANRRLQEDFIKKKLAQYIDDPTSTKILITGHSRGAAVANLLYLDMAAEGFGKVANENMYVYTFATPRSIRLTSTINNVHNIVNFWDVISLVPPTHNTIGINYDITPDSISVISEFNNLTQKTIDFAKWNFADYSNLTFTIRSHSSHADAAGGIIAWTMLTFNKPYQENDLQAQRITCNHSMEFYYSWCKTNSFPQNTLERIAYNSYTVACPVDVDVCDSDGVTLVSIVNNEIILGEDFCTVVEDKKQFLLPEDTYQFIITGYDDGEVNLTVTEYNEDFTKESFSSVRGLTISKDDVIVFSHDSSAENNDDRYRIMDRNGNIVPAEVLTGDELDAYTVEVTTSGDGAVLGDGSYDEGALVILNALPQDNNFLGWYENDVLISEELAYVFECEESRTLEARFTNLLDFNDLRILQQYFAGYPIELPEFLTDIDGDGTLTRRDCMFLARYLNGWEQYELPNKKNS